jgi:hypothetical protein
MAAIEQLLTELKEAVLENTEHLKVLNAGRAEALKAVDKVADAAAAGAAKPTRSRKAAAAEPAAVAEPEAVAPAAGPPVEETLRGEVKGYIDGGTTDAEKAARTENIKAIMAHFGGLLCGPASKLDDDQKSQALFFVRRYAAGCAVNFAQDYDFAGDPTQDGLEAAPAAADEFDIG